MLVIAKFGGTSVGNDNAFKQVMSIVQNRPEIRVVVLSGVSGITNKLIEVFKQPLNERRQKCSDIIAIHEAIIEQLELKNSKVEKLLEALSDELFSLSDF